ncbi:MAG: SpoIIE family protein phosphatase [Chloroflexaceae bacterium]|nr:SpoIIE family protein phosphatase [Chloroflexaceae bacterium]
MEPMPNSMSAEHRDLRLDFYRQSYDALRKIVRATGLLFLLSVVVFALFVFEPYTRIPELVLLDVLNAAGCIIWIVASFRPMNRLLLYTLTLAGVALVLVTNAGESVLLGDFMSIFLMTLAVNIFGVVLPWPTIWTAGMQGMVMVASISMGAYWKPFLIGPLVTTWIISLLSLVVHALLTHQRWEGFLNQHRIEQLNIELRAANELLQTHTDRLENELALARSIQQGLLPPSCPSWPGLDVVCYSKPALEVGGDFYSYHTFAHGHVALAVGDVSGKGVAAALLMAAGLSLFAATLSQDLSPGGRLAYLDQALVPYTRTRHQNCALSYVELNTRTLRVVNAGCIPPFIRRMHGAVEWPDVSGFALGYGLGSQCGYQEKVLDLPPGDLVVLISDGLVEAKNAQGDMFGFERFERAVAGGPIVSAQAMLSHLLAELAAFIGTTTPHDDITMVVFRVHGRMS